jgi:hypothetical protein
MRGIKKMAQEEIGRKRINSQKGEIPMKKQAYTMIAMMICFGCLVVSAKAQCESVNSIANIPFQFTVGKITLPAGRYSLTCFSAESKLLTIRSTDGKASAQMLMILVQRNPSVGGKLMFHRYGTRYFFSQVWAGGESTALELPKSRAERLVELESAGMKPTSETIALTGRR